MANELIFAFSIENGTTNKKYTINKEKHVRILNNPLPVLGEKILLFFDIFEGEDEDLDEENEKGRNFSTEFCSKNDKRRVKIPRITVNVPVTTK